MRGLPGNERGDGFRPGGILTLQGRSFGKTIGDGDGNEPASEGSLLQDERGPCVSVPEASHIALLWMLADLS